MSPLMKSLGIDRLSVPERIQLAADIWDSIPEESFELTPTQSADLDRRVAEHEAGRSRTSTWAEVKARLLGNS